MLAFEQYIRSNTAAFIDKLKSIAVDLRTDPNWLMSVMYAESKLNPAAQNTSYPVNGGYATGLIQFTPDTARSLGTTTEALKAMSNVKQLDYVYKYFKPYTGQLNSYFDVYLSVFFPAAIGKPDNWVFETSRIRRSSVARSNPIIDQNKDGQITVAEFKQYLYGTIPARFRSLVFSIVTAAKSHPLVTLAIVAGIVYLLKK